MILTFNSNVLKFGGFWLGLSSSPTPPPTPTIYHVTVPTVEHGTVAVNPTEGPTGTLVTISVVPDTGYELDTISLTGAELINGNQFYIDGSDVTVNVTFTAINYNPLGLPPYTIRVQIADGESVTPVYDPQGYAGTATRVSSSPNVWDLTYAKPDWSYAFTYGSNHSTAKCFRFSNDNSIKKVLGFNSTGITNMSQLLMDNTSLTEVAIFDTRNVVDAQHLFADSKAITVLPNYDFAAATNLSHICYGCNALTYVPNWNVPVCTNVNRAWNATINAQYGMLDFYNKVKDRISNFDNYSNCFTTCGKYYDYASEQARIERAQIPVTWGGDMQ